MKKTFIFAFLACTLTACHESLENRAAREAKEYTEKYCPTPYVNNTRTDSVVFDIASKTYTYYCSLNGQADSKKFIEQYHKRIHDSMIQSISNDTGTKKFKEAGFNFRYKVYSTKDKGVLLYDQTITPKDYRGK